MGGKLLATLAMLVHNSPQLQSMTCSLLRNFTFFQILLTDENNNLNNLSAAQIPQFVFHCLILPTDSGSHTQSKREVCGIIAHLGHEELRTQGRHFFYVSCIMPAAYNYHLMHKDP